jgi:hypothetical protein
VSGEFTFYVEPTEVLAESSRQVVAGLGEVGGLTLAFLGVGKEHVLLTVDELQHLTRVLESCDTERQARSLGYYLYRVVITEFPKGAWYDAPEEYGGSYLDLDWTPEGWQPDEEYISRFGTSRFFWPSTKYEYKSKSSAKARAKLIESFGAKTEVVQSSLITWPAEEAEEVW